MISGLIFVVHDLQSLQFLNDVLASLARLGIDQISKVKRHECKQRQ